MNLPETYSILDRFNNEPEEAIYSSNGDYKAFGVSRHAVSLNCITKDGNQTGISWSLYSDCRYDPSVGIQIEFTHKIIEVKGKHLLSLYHGVLGNRVTFIAEADGPTAKLTSQAGECVITELNLNKRDYGK